MKSILKFLFSSLALAMFTLAVLPADIAQAITPDSLAFIFNQAPGVMVGTVVLGSLGNVDGTSWQTPNPGGVRRLYLALKRDIVGIWPKEADIVAGEITTAPVMKATKTFSEYEMADGSCSLDDDDSGDPGFQSYKHTLGLMLAGFNKTLAAEMRKHLNGGVVAVVEYNDGTYAVGGSSDNAIYIKKGFKSGAKGSDKRGYTLKGEQDGFMWGVMPLATAAIEDLELAPQV